MKDLPVINLISLTEKLTGFAWRHVLEITLFKEERYLRSCAGVLLTKQTSSFSLRAH
jgi:hypothetical protein